VTASFFEAIWQHRSHTVVDGATPPLAARLARAELRKLDRVDPTYRT
jgi:hypothetical protein